MKRGTSVIRLPLRRQRPFPAIWNVIICLIMLTAGVTIGVRPAAATQTVAPAYSHLWYIDSVDVGAIQYLGQVDGQWDGAANHCGFGDNSSQDKVVVLDFGRPIKLYGDGFAYHGYGTYLINTYQGYLTDADIAYRVEQYAAQYFWNSGGSGGCPYTRIAIGTSNSFLCDNSPVGYCNAYDAGWQWSQMVTDVQNWLVAQGFSGRLGARGADDIETFGDDPGGEGFQLRG